MTHRAGKRPAKDSGNHSMLLCKSDQTTFSRLQKICTNLPREIEIMTAGPAGIRPMSTRKRFCAKFQFAFFSNLSVLEASKS